MFCQDKKGLAFYPWPVLPPRANGSPLKRKVNEQFKAEGEGEGFLQQLGSRRLNQGLRKPALKCTKYKPAAKFIQDPGKGIEEIKLIFKHDFLVSIVSLLDLI